MTSLNSMSGLNEDASSSLDCSLSDIGDRRLRMRFAEAMAWAILGPKLKNWPAA